MFIILDHQVNAITILWDFILLQSKWLRLKKKMTTIGADVGGVENLFTTGGNVNGYPSVIRRESSQTSQK